MSESLSKHCSSKVSCERSNPYSFSNRDPQGLAASCADTTGSSASSASNLFWLSARSCSMRACLASTACCASAREGYPRRFDGFLPFCNQLFRIVHFLLIGLPQHLQSFLRIFRLPVIRIVFAAARFLRNGLLRGRWAASGRRWSQRPALLRRTGHQSAHRKRRRQARRRKSRPSAPHLPHRSVAFLHRKQPPFDAPSIP